MEEILNKDWQSFEDEICSHFRSLGAEARTKSRLVGVRANHNVDVLVTFVFFGQEITWIIEAKYWKHNIPKEKVEALKSIVSDTGADRGFLISDKGFQKGAYQAAKKTNISLLTFSELKEKTIELTEIEVLKNYHDRIKLIELRYWSHAKEIRREYDLRGGRAETDIDYSVSFVISTAEKAIIQAIKRIYPISLETMVYEKYGKKEAHSFQQLVHWLNINLNAADRNILVAENKMQKDGKFYPKLNDIETTSFYLDKWKSYGSPFNKEKK